MFLKTGEMKKIMKASLKRYGLIVGNIDGHYLVYADNWGVYVEIPYATNKFKAAIMELIGDLPEPYECYKYTISSPDNEVVPERVLDYPDPYTNWLAAKDCAAEVPMFLYYWPHEYMVYQRRSDMQFVIASRNLTFSAISARELDGASEHMPQRPNILNDVLYFKNESTIYWVHTEHPGAKIQEALFLHMSGMSFFENDWLEKENGCQMDSKDDEAETEDGGADGQLPY